MQTRDVNAVATVLYVPITHIVHAPALYAPKEQAVQTSEVDEAATLPKRPNPHAVHTKDVVDLGRLP